MNPNHQKIKATISRYKRAMSKEQKEWGMINDGSGKRYLLGPLYLRVDDTQGALKHYQWFETSFPDDSGEPFHRMAWSLTLYRNGDTDAAYNMLLKTMFLNLYLFPTLFGENPDPIQMDHSTNWAELPYVQQAPKWMLGLWSDPEIAWAKSVYDSDLTTKTRDRYITIHQFLDLEPPGEKRSIFVEESRKLESLDFSCLS
ncbi:MAG: hypothetical protein ISR95_00355 [Candidatus Marinimicrobia bacterium]|nr:hypothetical protein [Candidatus Neomarinimicrobiota bacterium]